MSAPPQFLQFIENHEKKFIERLRAAVAIKSVSSDISLRPEVFKMGDFLESELKALRATVRKVQLGSQTGKDVDLPPVILAQVGSDPEKKTILCYGHYDVQPAEKADGWNTDPFELTEIDGKLFGRGSSDDKGPVLGWINVLQAHKELQLQLPVNLKLCFEGMEESGSQKLDDLVRQDKFFEGVDAVCITDSYWLNTRTPCLTYGLRGIAYFKVTISGPGQDLHSGAFGGMVYEPMTDLFHLMSKLVTPQGEITIPGINELVPSLTEEERKQFEAIDYSIDEFNALVGAKVGLSNDKVALLMGRMRYPSLSLHGIKGDSISKTVIPAKVTGEFSIRLVPNQNNLDTVKDLVESHLLGEFKKLNTKNTIDVELDGMGLPWVADTKHWNYAAGRNATLAIYGVEPNLLRDGGSIPVTLTFASLGTNVLMLPMGRGDDSAQLTFSFLSKCHVLMLHT